jgi:hypothetical protein
MRAVMVRLAHSSLLGRLIRQDEPVDELGISTYARIEQALDDGSPDRARELLRYMLGEYITIYRFMIEWIGDLSGFLSDRGDAPAWAETHAAAKNKVLEPRDGFIRGSAPALQQTWSRRIERLGSRKEDPETLGQDSAGAFHAAPDRSFLEPMWLEYLIPHDFVVAWAHELVTRIARTRGEDAVPEAISGTYEQRWKARYVKWQQMTPLERVQLSVEGMRGHLSGKSRRGDLRVWEEPGRYVISMDPCGSGGMLRTGDLVTGAGPYPTDGFNREPHVWTWNRTGVPWYSTHCPIVMEMFTTRDWGYPMRPVEFPAEPDGPCRWFVNKQST